MGPREQPGAVLGRGRLLRTDPRLGREGQCASAQRVVREGGGPGREKADVPLKVDTEGSLRLPVSLRVEEWGGMEVWSWERRSGGLLGGFHRRCPQV